MLLTKCGSLSAPTIARGLLSFSSQTIRRSTLTPASARGPPNTFTKFQYAANANGRSQRNFTSNVKKNIQKNTSHMTTNGKPTKETQSFLQRWMAQKEIPPRGTLKWYGEMTLLCTVFAITGTSTMVLVRPAMSEILGLKGSLKDGPWSYRICSLVIMTPLYAGMLVLVGTIFGRHHYFRHFAVKMFSRFGIPPELMDKTFHETAKNFRKY